MESLDKHGKNYEKGKVIDFESESFEFDVTQVRRRLETRVNLFRFFLFLVSYLTEMNFPTRAGIFPGRSSKFSTEMVARAFMGNYFSEIG